MRKLEELEGLILGGPYNANMRYADDTTITSTSEEKLRCKKERKWDSRKQNAWSSGMVGKWTELELREMAKAPREREKWNSLIVKV